MTEPDRLVAYHFLRALYRPAASTYRIIVDPNAEELGRHIPLRQRRSALSSRLAALRAAPRKVLRIVIHSGDDSAHPDFLVVEFHRIDGRFDVIPLSTYPSDCNLSIDVRHWPDGTRLIDLSNSWIHDENGDAFHLRKGERTYRFAISLPPAH